MISYDYNLDMVPKPKGSPLIVPVNQYDDDFLIRLHLYASTGDFSVETGTTARIRGTKPDGNAYSDDCTLTVEQGKPVITVKGDKQMTAASGGGAYEITLFKGNVELSSANFVLHVERAALDKDTVVSNSKVRELVNVLDNSDAIINAGQQYADAQEALETLAEQVNSDKLEVEQNKLDTIELKDQITQIINDSTESIDNKTAAIVSLIVNSDQIAMTALQNANNAAGNTADLSVLVDEIQRMVEALEQARLSHVSNWYVENGVAYGINEEGDVITDPLEGIGGGGGGGGGGGSALSTMSLTNTSGFNAKSIANGDSCVVSIMWSSIESDMPTGNGTLKITVNGVVKSMRDVAQGEVSLDISEYLTSGANNSVRLTVTDAYGQSRFTMITITVIAVSLESNFDDANAYQGPIIFTYTPRGNVSKTLYFLIDGSVIGTETSSYSGTSRSFTIPQQSHGVHTFEAYFDCEVNGQTVTSNRLHYEIVCVEPLNTTPIVASSYNKFNVNQFETANIDLTVYDPLNMEASVNVALNGRTIETLTVDRSKQIFSYRFDVPGTQTLTFTCGSASKSHTFTVTESDIQLVPIDDQLQLHLSSAGRSNNENNPATWEYGTGSNKIAAQFSGFNWTRDGWILDDNGYVCLRTLGGSKVTIPFTPYDSDFRSSGKTIEIELATHNVLDYTVPIISCMDGDRGFEIFADNAVFKSARSEMNPRFTTDTKLRLSMVVQPQSEYRLIYMYIDGEYQGIIQYPQTDSFRQNSPKGISIGNALCGVDIYEIRVYNKALTSDEILTNYVADRQDVAEMLILYRENWIKNEYGKIDITKLPTSLPYVIFTGPESPQYKGDKKTVNMEFVNPADTTRGFTATGVVTNVQGTSSQYYYVKNIKFTLKNGATVNGILIAGYSITANGIVVDTFTLKADVASSESANNIVIAKLYEDLSRQLNILTPPQKTNGQVRQGMDGFPIVMFWDYGDGPVFIGKYNFLNDKGTPDTFGFKDGDEAWDVRSNTSQLSKFHTATFNDNWYTEDYESIFPEDYSNDQYVRPMTEFLYSTWQDEATGNDLDSPVTYEGTTYNKDTAAYRLAKYKALYPTFYDITNAAFYYVFTLLFLMVDNRQKNEHLVYWADTGKWWELIYDCDTALGNDNRGNLTFEYWMEDIDLINNEYVFNGADNVKWMNFRQAFWNEAKNMYQRMRSTGIFSADYIKTLFANWQSAWSKEIWNEDGDYKYVEPLRKEGTTTYLSMAYGSKRWQRNEFLEWRFPYIDSLFDVGDALLSIMFRPYYQVTEAQRLNGDIDLEIEVYKKSYVTVLFDDVKVSKRVIDDSYKCTIENPLAYANDAVCGIHSAKMIKDVKGMENLYVGFWDSTNAPNLQAVRLGKADANYTNTATKTVSVGSNYKLTLVDMRGCTAFGTDAQKVLDLAHCPNIREVYLDRTQAKGVDLPNGGVLEALHLPASTTSIVLRNHPKLTDSGLVVASYDNLDQIWLENMTGLDTKAILQAIPVDTAVRMTGFTWEVANAAEIDALYALIDTMHGLDINSEEVDTAQMSGTIHTSSLRGDQIAGWQARYPSIKVVADHVSSTLTYKSYDGATVLKTVECSDGVPQSAAPSIPSRSQTAQYSYTGSGWSRETDSQTATYGVGGPTSGIMADTEIFAAYTWTVRTYTVTWKNSDNTVLETDNNVPYGTTPTYNGATPQNPTSGGGAFTGWNPSISQVVGNVTYTASYVPMYTVTWYNDDRTTVLDTQTVRQGGSVTYGGASPVSTEGSDYTFIGWDKVTTNIQSNLSVYARFRAPSDAPTATTADGAYGVEWNYNTSATTLTRKGLAASFGAPTPATSISGSGSSPFDNIAPWKDMKRYNVIGTEFVPETDSRFSQTTYDTVVYIPEFYYTAYKDTTNSKWLWAISPTAKEGYKKHPGSGKYIGRYHTSGDSSAVYSKSGFLPLANTSRTNFRTYSSAKSNGWRMLDLASWSALQMLYLVEFANFDSQTTLGKGWNTGSVDSMGGTDDAVYHTIKVTGSHNQYRWIEDPFSNVMDWIDGAVMSNRKVYTETDSTLYSDAVTNLKDTEITLPSSSGYIKDFGYSEDAAWAFIPNTGDGSASTYVSDYVSSGTGVKALRVGGNYSGSDNYGFFYFYASYDASGANAYIGSRLLKEPA